MSNEPRTKSKLPETAAERAPAPSGAARGVILVTSGGAAGRIVSLSGKTPVSFGRSEECTVALPDVGISRVHAEIQALAGEYMIRDSGSTNGTFVNDERVDFSAPLAHGDAVRLGANVRMRFTLVDEAEERDLVRVHEALSREAERLAPRAGDAAGAAPGVVCDPAMRAVYEQAGRAAKAMISVLVLGETGVGKEVLAGAIHRASPRARGPFLALNCAALSETLLEAELFGHEKGAFTGAVQARPGLFEAAEGGTVFLDEVGELPMSTQVKLLRVLEDRKVMRVGARAPRAIDVRFVSATNRDLEAEAARGAFRQDLFFRLNGIALTIPPLRERRSEIAQLASLFVARACVETGRADVPVLSDGVQRALLEYAWPGNVRELRNVIERAVVLCAGPTLLPEHLPPKVSNAALPNAPLVGTPAAAPAADGETLRDRLSAVERQRIIDVLEQCGGNQTRAAEQLGISRRTLVARLQEWGLTRPRARPGR